MAATKRNAGLTSAVPRQSLNDEELVSNDDFAELTYCTILSKLINVQIIVESIN